MSDRKERTATGRFGPGNAGRPVGTPNKSTMAAKTAFQLAFDKLGGWERLAQWAASDNDNLKEFYKLYSKLIPQDVTSGGNALPAVTINVPPIDGGPQP
jgi:hypothetical protein